jgi:hypothetical protein
MCLLISCQGKVTTPEKNNNIQEMRISVEGLEKKTIYYWKVVAKAEGMNDFTSETPVRNFITTY